MATKKRTQASKGTIKKAPVKKSAAPQQKTIDEAIKKAEEPVEKVEAKQPEQAAPIVEAKQPEQKAQDKSARFKILGKPQFWRNHISLERGLVHGAVLVGDMDEFFARTPKPVDFSRWMNSKDLVQDRIDRAKAKAKARK